MLGEWSWWGNGGWKGCPAFFQPTVHESMVCVRCPLAQQRGVLTPLLCAADPHLGAWGNSCQQLLPPRGTLRPLPASCCPQGGAARLSRAAVLRSVVAQPRELRGLRTPGGGATAVPTARPHLLFSTVDAARGPAPRSPSLRLPWFLLPSRASADALGAPRWEDPSPVPVSWEGTEHRGLDKTGRGQLRCEGK